MNETFVTVLTVIMAIVVAVAAVGCIYYETHGEDADLSEKEKEKQDDHS